MKKKNQLMIAILKNSAIKLRANYQLPSYLVYRILEIDNNCTLSEINYLKYSCEHYLRVKGYYKKYPLMEKEVNEIIKNNYKKMG